jgi:preprotein translocase SecE subunit
MAVAVKNTPEAPSHSPFDRLAVSSLAGVAYVLASIAVLFYAIPGLWTAYASGPVTAAVGSFMDAGLLVLVMAAAAVGLGLVGLRLAGRHPPHGLRAGIFFGTVGVLAIAFVTLAIGAILEGSPWFRGETGRSVGLGVMAAVGLALLVVGGRYFMRPEAERWLIQVEDQGWFTAEAYKRSQGQQVRRGTILGILILAGAGIYTMLAHQTLQTGSQHWDVAIPFTAGATWRVLPDVAFTVPLLLAAASLWLAYRVVNFPTFADFLIATEAELKKVSWTTRKRLVQDTIVVLTTVILMTAFLFVVDVMWSWGLSKIGVIQAPPEQAQTAQQEQQPW